MPFRTSRIFIHAAWTLVSTLTLFGSFVSGAFSQNLIVNGSFEDAVVTAPAILPPGSTEITGWVTTRASIGYIGDEWTPSDGSRSIHLDGAPGAGGIAQSFATVPGNYYEVNFDLSGHPGGPPAFKSLRVEAAGRWAIFEFDTSGRSLPDNMGWERRNFSFVAVDTVTTLEFYSLDDSSGDYLGIPLPAFGPAIDNVEVVELIIEPTPTPTPSPTPIPPARPDAVISIRRGMGFVGDNDFSFLGEEQVARTSQTRGASVNLYVTIQNEGETPAEFQVKGQKGSRGFKVYYFDKFTGGRNITRGVTSGTQIITLGSREQGIVRVVVEVLKSAKPGQVKRCRVTVKSTVDQLLQDAVIGRVRAIKSRKKNPRSSKNP